MKNILLSLAITIVAMAGAINAHAQYQQEVKLSTGWFGVYDAGQTWSHNFGQPTYVERLIISAEGRGQAFTMAQVYADGDFVSNMGLPGRDPDYPVVIRKAVTSIMIKFQGRVQLNDIRAYVQQNGSAALSFGYGVGDLNTVHGVADIVLKVVAALQETATDADFQLYLKPLRKAALRLTASAAGRPHLSVMTQAKAKIMIDAITAAEPFLDMLSDHSYYVPAVQNLLFVKEKLQSSYEMP